MVANNVREPLARITLCFCFFVVCASLLNIEVSDYATLISSDLKTRTSDFAKKLVKATTQTTCIRSVEQSYNGAGVEVRQENPIEILNQFISDIQELLLTKREHVRRIAEKAEAASAEHHFNPSLVYNFYNLKKLYESDENLESLIKKNVPYLEKIREDEQRMKEKIREQNKWRQMKLQPNTIYRDIPVNLNHSGVHIPVNVFNEKPTVMNSIKWSEALTRTFKQNKNTDSDLYWQYFCSNDGFLRLYPSAKWRPPKYMQNPEEDSIPLDLYDCRLRKWYTKAAASPKDLVILLDRSGSMTGQRKEISRNVVVNILESLTEDDFVTILGFNSSVSHLVDCFGNKLVQANKQNIRAFRDNLGEMETAEIANFTQALRDAFDILDDARKSKYGAQCNQAIMLVTDGAPETYHEIFEEYNAPVDQFGEKQVPVRVFTYLIGKEVTDTQEVHDIACRNRGYYTHVANNAEVREQVQLYIPVMSRPLVLSKDRPYIYTNVYTDVADVPLLNWIWDTREKEKMRENQLRKIREKIQSEKREKMQSGLPDMEDATEEYEEYEKSSKSELSNETVNVSITDSKRKTDDVSGVAFDDEQSDVLFFKNIDLKKAKKKSVTFFAYPLVEYMGTPGEGIHDLMITIAAPVFDQKNTSNITEKYLEKNTWKLRTVEVRSANLLGVAGVDISIREVVKYAPSHRLGVNGYSFVVNNNGYVMYHPDLRPLFQDLIKPYFGSVDIAEVELQNDGKGPRVLDDSTLQSMRTNLINRVTNSPKFEVKIHLDAMKRVVTRTNIYTHGPIEHTPFSLGISVPEAYGLNSIVTKINMQSINALEYFKDNNWRVHPDWYYCIDNPINSLFERDKYSTEEAILFVLEKMSESPDSITLVNSRLFPSENKENKILCDKALLENLVFDAKVTLLNSESCDTFKRKISKELHESVGAVLTFVATRSGFTRYFDLRSEAEKANTSAEEIFADIHNKAIDEIFYQRSVDYHQIDSNAFLFSVPFEFDERSPTFVTATKALFFASGKNKAPAAVSGALFNHEKFTDFFFSSIQICSKAVCNGDNCTKGDIHCYLLDNNAFIVVSQDPFETGKFFGEVDTNLLKSLVEKGVYKEIEIFDYQAICIQDSNEKATNSSFEPLKTPFSLLKNLILRFISQLYFVALNILITSSESLFTAGEFYSELDTDYATQVSGFPIDEKGKPLTPNKTTPFPCDKKFNLYERQVWKRNEPLQSKYKKCEGFDCDQEYIVESIENTNLLLIAVKTTDYNVCPCDELKAKITPERVNYGDSSDEESCVERNHFVDRYRSLPHLPCVNTHPEEYGMLCGQGWALKPPFLCFILLSIFSLIVYQRNAAMH